VDQLTLTAPDISCEHCRRIIERELGVLPGVQTVSVDVPSKQVNVSFDPAQISRAVIVTKLDEEGYSVLLDC
jgi:copper chaperone